MKHKIRAVLFLCFLWLITPVYSVSAADDSGLCRISLHSLSKTSGAPGDTIEMYGVWGETQETKTPCINKGGANKLEVLSWGNSVIKVRIPEHLPAGSYKVGVYCNYPPRGRGSNWKNFEVIGSSGVESRSPEIQSLDTKTGPEVRPQKSDTQAKTSESALSNGYTQTFHKFKLAEHHVEGTVLKFEFPDEKMNTLYLFNFSEWESLTDKTNQAIVRLYDSEKNLLDEGKSICIRSGKIFGSIPFSKINRANVEKVAYFTLAASPCMEGKGGKTLRLKDNPELKPLFEDVSTVFKILLECMETGKSEQDCICGNKGKMEEPIRRAKSFLQEHPELKGKELSLFEESTHHEGASEKVSISMSLDELPRLQDELRRCR